MPDVKPLDLEQGQQLPKFVEPYQYGQHHTIDLETDGQNVTSYEYLAKDSISPWHEYASTSIGSWLYLYDPNRVTPNDQVLHNIKFIPGKRSESIAGYGIYTETTLIALHELHQEIKESVVVDYGSGEGIQSLAALKIGAKHVILFENNKTAITKAGELMAANGYGKDKYTVILDTLDNAIKHRDVLAKAEIGIANIGAWVQYEDAYLKAIEATNYSPKMRYYIAGGYPYSNYGDENKNTWHKDQKAVGEDMTLEQLGHNNFFVVDTCDGHSRGLMNCARTFITKRDLP